MVAKSGKLFVVVLMMFGLLMAGQAAADPDLGRITAEQAFQAVQTQQDPFSGESRKVMLVDVRTRAEFYWVGAPCQVDGITLDNDTVIVPDLGKANLIREGRILLVRQNGWLRLLPVKRVKSVALSPIAINIPYKLWDEASGKTTLNEGFAAEVEALALEQGVEVVIFYCRSGVRSENCLADFDSTLFYAVYEIDQPDLQSGFGGFEGTSYGNAYLGYRGFPRRDTDLQETPSVSWKDAGLPIKTGVDPFTR